jgi:hypothetical protein
VSTAANDASADRRRTANRSSTDPVDELAAYASARGLELAPYHDACRQLKAMLGTQFAEHRFADSVLARLTLDSDVPRAVSDAHAAALDA